MIRRKQDCPVEYREHMRGGAGTVRLTSLIFGPEELNGKGRLFSVLTLEPGCGIGYHVHEHDAELFYILQGTAEYSDNGETVTLGPGDVAVCAVGQGHSIRNLTDETVRFLALIVYE